MTDRPKIVGPEYIAELLNVKVAAVKTMANSSRANLPERIRIPGRTRLMWVEQDVLDWLANNPQAVNDKANIDLMQLLVNATEVRNLPGVYFLLSGTVVCYIGQSSNVIGRMGGHQGKDFDTAKMVHIRDIDERCRIEDRLIKLFCPLYNMQLLDKESELVPQGITR